MTLSSSRSPWDHGPPSMSGLVGWPRQSQRPQEAGGQRGSGSGTLIPQPPLPGVQAMRLVPRVHVPVTGARPLPHG